MKRKIPVIIALCCCLGILFSYYYFQETKAQTLSLNQRLKALGLPVISLKTISLVPYKIEIQLQSPSTNTDLAYGDIWNMTLINHVLADNFRTGKTVVGYTMILKNTKGDKIDYDEINLYKNELSSNFGMSNLDDASSVIAIRNNLEYGHFTLAKVEVTSLKAINDPGQILEIDLVAKNEDDAAQSLATFSPSLEQVLYKGQKNYGTYIVLCHVLIRDEAGNIMGESVEDVENETTTGIGLNIGQPNVVYPMTPQPTITTYPASKNASSTPTTKPVAGTSYPAYP